MSYRYYFIDGYVCELSYKMNKLEKTQEERKHGKCFRIIVMR